MKKYTTFALALVMALMCLLPSLSMAEQMHYFSINNVNCISESDELKYYKTEIWKYSSQYSRVKVNHHSNDTTNSYTNLFHATRSDSTNQYGTLCGQKWCTPNLAVNISSNAIYVNKYYGLACRGNTKYNTYEDLTTFNVSGGYDPN